MTDSPRWPTVIFDLDGTLVDTVPLIVASYQHTFQTHLGRTEDEARIKNWIGQPLIRAFREVDPDLADQMYATYLEWNNAHTEEMIRPFAGAGELLTALAAAGVRVGVATSKRRGQAQRALALTGLDSLIDPTVTLEDTSAHKPDPEPIRLACKAIGALEDESVYVGDAAVDVLAGQAAGLQTVAVTWGAGTPEALRAAKPTVQVDSMATLGETLLPDA
ncbi:HAD family hydrolase [Demetria terragena]|uniref:HAD family hydrolase n=1 Tax=Demetria terragena TaxID=63959 RepID=UPI000367E3B8|nr:HAD-IA family hydrolase [Demetria terragena]